MNLRVSFFTPPNEIGTAVLIGHGGEVLLGEVVSIERENRMGDTGFYSLCIRGRSWSLSLSCPEHEVEIV